MAKRVTDENQKPSVQQELEKLFPSTRGGGRRDESREVHRVGAGELSASIIQLIQIQSTTKQTTAKL